jgi:DNA-binding transcriptional regulator YdaS (Cro superfamily)
MDTNKIIDDMGGTSAVARLFGVTPGAVTQWRSKGIPSARLMCLRLMNPNTDWSAFDGAGKPITQDTVTQ